MRGGARKRGSNAQARLRVLEDSAYLEQSTHFIHLTAARRALLRPRGIFPPRCRGSSTHPHVS